MRNLLFILLICMGVFIKGKAQVSGKFAGSGVDSATYFKIIRNVVWSDTMPDAEAGVPFSNRSVCKSYDEVYLIIPGPKSFVQAIPAERDTLLALPNAKKRTPLLKVTGNILYDVNYRSRIDTPYAENDIYQHTLQTRLDMVYKERYPFRVYLTTRFSNSSLFRKYTDLNFQFSQADFKRLLKAKAMSAVESYINSKIGELDSLKNAIDQKRTMVASLRQDLQQPDISQKLVEERERNLFGRPNSPSLPDAEMVKAQINLHREFKFNRNFADSLRSGMDVKTDLLSNKASGYQKYKDSIERKKDRLDSLTAGLETAEKLYRKVKSMRDFDLGELKKQIEGAKDVNVLSQKLRQLNIPDTILPKGYKTLAAIQSFSIGRSTADYSELSVKNISITGLQVEYNPGYYYAVAVGKVDYRFRDYIIPNHPRSNQYVALARFGKGTRNGNHVILTYYTGRRQFFNASIASQANGRIPEYNLAGLTVEGFYQINRNISLIGEVAKSTMPYYSLDSLQRKGWMNSVAKFNERSNEAYAVKLFSYFPRSQTRFTGNLRYTGSNFQSFSTFTSGASQLRWLTKLEQPFFKKQLTIISSLQQNDYNNPFVTTAYKSSSLLASFQANLRIKKWPVISLGYFPSYQLTKAGDDQYSESRYHTLTGSAGYFYNIKKIQLTSYLVYSQFYNDASDSGFVYYNSKNLLLSQNIILKRLSLMMNASLSTSTEYNMYTVESGGQFTISRTITVGGGVKMINHSLQPALQWGYSGNLTLRISKLGEIQLMMDKGFIPGLNRQPAYRPGRLVENRMGRLTYYKTF